MRFSYDKNGNRIDAETYSGVECFCPACNEKLSYKDGDIITPYFSHKPKSKCVYGRDSDNKCEWHRSMQALFPIECNEVCFKDKKTGEVHIADIFIEKDNTVIEFQHSSIKLEEFKKRTEFHISEGRKIVWIFDISNGDVEYGKLKMKQYDSGDLVHDGLLFSWPYSSKHVLRFYYEESDFTSTDYFSACLFLGGSENIVHQIVSHDLVLSEITLSVHNIKLHANMDCKEFFIPEDYWTSQSPWKEKVDARNRIIQKQKELENAVRMHDTAKYVRILNGLE